MSAEPFIVEQVSGVTKPEDMQAWYRKQAEDAKALGMTFARISYHDERPDVLLFEGWKEQPQDQGPVRWRWCVHMPGPDEVYAAVSKEAAQEHADKLKACIERFYERCPRTENDPSVAAMTPVVILWPWSAADHDADVIRWTKEASHETT